MIWATPSHLDDFESRKQEDQSPVPREAFFKDLPNHCLLPLLRNISKCLVIHGSADELVPVERAWEIFHHLGEPKELRIIEGGDHRLTQPAHRQQALDLTVSWFKKYL